MRGRLVPLVGAALVVVLLCLGGWLLLRTTGAQGSAVPTPITIPSRDTATPTSTSPSAPTSDPRPPAPVPTDVVAPPPAVDDDDDDDGPGDDGGDDGDD